MSKTVAFVALLSLTTGAFAQNNQLGAQSAETILSQATIQAAKENKNILVKFSASWCGWCHRMDDWLKKTDEGKMVADQYVIVTLIVNESEEHKAEETPGGDEVLKARGGTGFGIPYFVVIDTKGHTLITSVIEPKSDKPSNIGFPVEDFEIAHFMKMIKTTSKLKTDQLTKAENSLKENAKKIKGGG